MDIKITEHENDYELNAVSDIGKGLFDHPYQFPNNINKDNLNSTITNIKNLNLKVGIFSLVNIDDIEIKESKTELLDCIHNFMGIIDTPIGRRQNRGKIVEEAIQIGRNIMERNNRSIIG